MEKDDFLKLFAKKLADGLTSTEQLDYNLYLATHQQDKDMARLLENFYLSTDVDGATDREKLADIWKKIDSKESTPSIATKKPYKKVIYLLGSVAAVLLALFLFGISYFKDSNTTETLSQQSGDQRLFIVLADGTQVTLDKQATLTYNRNFGINNRDLQLEGTAFFDVAKDTLLPMRIAVGDWKVQVVGTSFTIKPTASDAASELFLYDGCVKLFDRRAPEQVYSVSPGQKANWISKSTADARQPVIHQVGLNELKASKSWVQDSIVFKNQKLKDLKTQIEQKYHVKIIFENKQLMEKRYSGSIKDLKIDALLNILKTSYPFEYEMRDSVIVLR